MTQRIELDGEIHEFPDDFSDADIAAALGNGPPAAPPAKPKPRSILQDINTGIEQAADWATLGGFRNYRAATDAALSNGKESFLQAKDRGRAETEDFNRRRPVSGVASKTIGGVLPALLTGGESNLSNASRTASVAPPSFWARRGNDAVKGALFGSIFGANEAVGKGDRPLEQAADIGANAGMGALTGPVLGGLIEGGGALATRFGPKPKVEGPIPDEVYLTPGPALSSAKVVNQPQKVPQKTTRDMVAREQLKLLNQGQKTVGDLRQDYTDFQNAGIKPTLAELGGARTRQRGRTLANSPGKTPALAERVIDAERNTQLPKAIERTNQAFGQISGEQTPSKSALIIADVASKKDAMGNVYKSLFNTNTKISPEAEAQIENVLKRVPELDQARAAMKISAQRDGLNPSSLSKAQQYKYIKEHMDDVIAALAEKKPNEARRAIDAQKALVDAMESGIPGYKNANKVYEGLSKQQDAIDFGRSLLVGGRSQMSMADARVAKSKMSRQELESVQAGLRDDIERMLTEASGSVDAPRNAIAVMKNAYADKIRLWLGPQAESYIRALRTMGRSYRNESFMYPGSGSNTFSSKMDSDEAFLNIRPDKHSLAKMVDEAAGMAWTKATTPWREGLRDRQGELLFSRMSKADLERLASELAFQQNAQRQAAIASRSSGLFGAQFGQQAGQ